MKTKLLRFSKRSLAMLLSLLMMLSVLSVGSIITTAAADTITLYYQKDMPSGNYSASSSKAMTQSAKNTSKYYASVSLQNGSYGFYVKWGNDYYKVSATATTDQDVLLYNYGSTNYGNSNHRVTYSTGAATTFTFTFDTSNNKICVRPRASTTVKIAWSTASGHDGDWNLGTYDTMTHTSDGLYTKDLSLNAVKHYMFIQTNNTNYYRSSNTLTQNSTDSGKVAKMYYYGTDNYGGSGDKVNFTPNSAGKYRFTYDIKDQTVTMYRLYDITYNKGSNGTGTVSATTKVHGTNATLSSSTFTRSGYTQTGWSTSDGGAKAYDLGGTYTANAAATLYPYWTQNTYAITLSETGGSGTMKIDGTTRSSGYAVTHGNHTFTVTAPTGKVVKSISGIGTWSGEGTETASLDSTSITSAKTITVEYEDAGTCGFTLSKSSTTLNIGGTDTITVTPNAYHSGGTISATSSNTSVATVSYNTSTNKATITAKSHGTATITISCTEGGSATISVTVNTPTISIALGSSSLNIGGTTTITPTVTNQGTATVTYTSSNTSVATISGTTITAVAPGTTNITATVDGVTSTAKTLTVNTPTINVANNTTIKVGATYTPTATLTNPSTASGKWTVGYVLKSGTTATTNGTTITAVNYGSKTTFTAQYKYDGTVVATKDFDVTPVTPSISAYSYSAINVGGTANPSVTKSNVDNMTVSYSIKSGSAVTINSTSGQITGVVPTASNATTVTVTYTYGSCSVSRDATVTVNTPSITQGNVTIAKGDSKTLSTATTDPSSGLTVTFALSGSPNGVTCTSAGVVTVAQNSTASTATVVATAKNSGGTTVATKNITVTIETPTLTVKDGSTSVADGTVYTSVGTNKALTVGQNFSGDVTAKSANTSVATVSLNNGTLTITPVAKGTTKVSVSTDSGYTPTNAPAALLSASPLLLLGATPSVATQTVEFTVNVAEADTNHYVYFSNGGNWSSPTIHAWGSSGTQANRQAMTKIGVNDLGQDVYAYKFSSTDWAKVQNIHFLSSSGATWSDSSNANNTHTFTGNELSHTGFYNDGTYDLTIVKPQITANNVTIDMGSTQTMTATVLTSGTPSTFNWSSGTASVATTANTHTASNVITGVAPGNSTITVKAYAEKPSGWASIVTDGTADDYVAGTATATATVVAENKTVTFGAKKTDDGSTFTDLSGAVTAKYYDADTSGSGSSGSGSGSDPEPAGGPYYLHIGRQNDFVTNEAIEFTWNGSYYYAEYTVETANTDYPFVINTKNTALGDSDKSASSQAVTTRAANYDPDNIYNNVFNYLGDYNTYSGYGAFKIIAKNANTKIYITFASTSAGVVYRSSITSSSGSSGGSSGSSGTSGEGTTMTSPASVPYGKVAKFTAEATKTVSDVTYHFAEWVDGSGNKLSSDNPYSITVTADKTVYARYYRVYKLSAFDSYTSDGTNVNFVTSPPKVITVKHGDETFIYTYDGTKATGNPDSPDGNHAAALPIESGTYGQGNYIQYYAGDEITLHYSAMSSSEIFKGVFYNNSTDYYVAKPTAEGFIAHDYTTEHTLYMNSAYYASVPSGLPTTTVDNDDHTIKFTGTKDFKNIDVEMATKRKVYFSDYTNAIIGSKNIDDYYYDGEALSVTGDQLTVKAAGNASQTNSINKNNVKVYRADANGQPTGDPLSGYTVSYDSGTDPVTNSGASDSTRYIIISGTMPSYDLYIDLGITSSYTIKLGSKVMSDSFENKTRLADEVANITIKEGSTTKLTAPNDADVTSTSTSVNSGTALTLSSTFTGSWGDYYMFVGWYWGDDSAPDFQKGYISDKASLSYTPKKGGTIWAVGTRNLYINGSKYITGKDNDWYSENSEWKNQEMKFDADSGRYYWEITDTMFASAGSNYKTWGDNNPNTTYGSYYTGDDQNYYWSNNDNDYHGKSFFQITDSATGYDRTLWSTLTSYKAGGSGNGPTYGKIYPPEGDYDSKQLNGQGFINFNETDYEGYSSPLRIYFDPSKSGNARLTVEATQIYSNLYVSNGFDVGSTSRTSLVTVEPVVDGVVKTSGQTGWFDVNKQGDGWDPDIEGHVNHYRPKKKAATVRITKTVGGSDKIAAFFIYDVTNKTVRAERNVQHSGSNYYIDLTLAGSTQNLYIVPIVEEAGANVTISFDATQLNRKQWGDIVTAYAWYSGSGGNALGGYPGQPMIPSDDMTTWTTTFKGKNSNNDELQGITFSNYVDGAHSWLGCSDVMSSVTYGGEGTAGNPTTVTFGDNGLIKQYNYIESGTNKEYSRGNFKAQTYDYREPIALYDRFSDASDSISISFSMKDGNSNLLSRQHSQLTDVNILTLEKPSNNTTYTWSPLRWEYLTNAKGDKYIDLNGNPIKSKPTASFYIAAKGQVLYNNSSMTNVFHTGKQQDSVSGVTYGGASGVSMNYAVQWYVYDAQGNYITNVLTAGIADMSTNGVDSYIGKVLEDKGYPVDGKSVSICYDKPRYMYGDSETASEGQAAGYNGKGINVGNDFDAYRFTGQWNAVASNELVKVNVGVGMMTDSGEVLASSNTAAYGNASATYDTTKGNNTRVTDEDGNEAPFTASDGSFVRTAVRDATNSPVKLNASSQNFIGWYYYDANTGDFVKASYTSNENFYPNYSNKDVKFYAMYRASAVYQYKYTGREGARTYSAAGNDLSEYELGHGSVIRPADHEADIKLKVPVGIGVFKKNIDFTATNYDSWTKTPDNNGYVLDITGFATSLPTYTLTVHYKDASGNPVTITDSAVYNDKAVDLTSGSYTDSKSNTKPAGTAVTTYYGTQQHKFLGWYEYKNGETGDLLSTQANYGLRLTRKQEIIAVYDENNHALPSGDNWSVHIDENEVNKELTTVDTGVFYNDTIVRVRKGADVKATLPSGAKIGVLVVCDNKTGNSINNYNSTQLTTLANAVTVGKTKTTGSGLSITNMQAAKQTSFNRTDLAARRDYKSSLGAKYCVYAYIYDGSSYTFSEVSDVKTYE